MTITRIGPQDRTKTERREIRGAIRNLLGTSREDPPRLGGVLVAVGQINRLLRKTTNGCYRLRIEKLRNGEWYEPSTEERHDDVNEWSEW